MKPKVGSILTIILKRYLEKTLNRTTKKRGNDKTRGSDLVK